MCTNTPSLTPRSPNNDLLLTPNSCDDSPHSTSSTSSSTATSISHSSFHATQYHYFPSSFSATKPKQKKTTIHVSNDKGNDENNLQRIPLQKQQKQQEEQNQLKINQSQNFLQKRKKLLNSIPKLSISTTTLKQLLRINDKIIAKLISKTNRHIEFCFICFKGGELIHCSCCPISYHTRFKYPNWICSLCQLIQDGKHKTINNPYYENIYNIIQDILERLINIPEFEKFYRCEFDDESTSLKYYTTISYPICLEAIIAKFQSHIYTTYESIFFDLQNIFRNAILFYGKNNEIGLLSELLSEYVTLLWCEWLYDIECNSNIMPIKRKNAYTLGVLSNSNKEEKRPAKIIKINNDKRNENESQEEVKNEKSSTMKAIPKKVFPLRNRMKEEEEGNEKVKVEKEEKSNLKIKSPQSSSSTANKYANILRKSSSPSKQKESIIKPTQTITNTPQQRIKNEEVTHKKIAPEAKVKVKRTKTYTKPKVSLALLQKQYSLSNTIMKYLKTDNHVDFCLMCFDGGELVICSRCPSSFHRKCIRSSTKELPDDWICKYCEKEIQGKVSPAISDPYNDSMFSVAKIILQRLMSIPNMNSFHRLSNEYKEHYCKVIKNPIFLDDIKKKFEEMKYVSTKEIYNDLQLLWNNTRRYNLPKSSISSVALSLSELTSLLWCNFYYDIPSR